MYDKAKVYQPPESNTCKVNDWSAVISTQKGPREYVYNLLPRNELEPRSTSKRQSRIKLPAIEEERARLKAETKPNRTFGAPSGPALPRLQAPQRHSAYLRKQAKRPLVLQQKLQKQLLEDEYRMKSGEKERQSIIEQRKGRPPCIANNAPKPPIPLQVEPDMDEFGNNPKCLRLHGAKKGPRANFVQRNAIQHVITAMPGNRIPRDAQAENPAAQLAGTVNNKGPKFVDTRHGDKQSFASAKTHSGLKPHYVWKQHMGEMPPYLQRRLAEIEAGRERFAHYANERQAQRADYLLTPEQRTNLLNGLKAAWDKANRRYLGLSSSSDTLKSRAYKLHLEAEMDRLERDVELVERHRYLFIQSEDNQGVGAQATQHMQPQPTMC